jgi:hypothetical protein
VSGDHSCACSLDAFEALIHIDAIVCKAAVIEEAKRLAEIERRLYQVSMSEFERRARPATAALVSAIRAGRAKDETSTLMLMTAFDKRFKDLPAALDPFYEKAVEEAYAAGREAIYKKAAGIYPMTRDITYPSPHQFESVNDEWVEREKAAPVIDVIPSFTVADEQAIETLKKHQVFWVGKHYDDKLSQTIANATVSTMIKQGFDRAEGAKAVKVQLDKILSRKPGTFSAETIIPHGWNGSVAQYYEGLAANTMTVSRTFGTMSGLRGLGATSYVISNPVDERTCELCGDLAGTVYPTGEGAAIMDGVLGATDPTGVKNIMRWDTLKTVQTRTGGATMGPKATPGDAKALASNGYGLPPFHFRCRCVVDIGPATNFGVPLDIGFVPPPPPTPGFKMPPIRFPGDVSKMKAVEKQLDGVNKKVVFTDDAGADWMFKPYIPEREYRAWGDVLADHMAQALNHPSSPTYIVRHKGELGSIQKMYTKISGNTRHANWAALTKEELRAIQKEHAFDWLISNHDGHAGNMLVRKGKLVGIDKGQAYKFFPKDSIAWSFNPNSQYGEFSVYNDIMSKYSQGKLGEFRLLTAKDKEVRKFLKTIEDLDDKTFTAILKPYAQERAKQFPDTFNADEFLAAALKRKKNLTKDLTGIWNKATKQRDEVLGKPKTAAAKLADQPKGKPVTPLDKSFVDDVQASQWKGKSLSVGGDSVQDGSVMVYAVGKDKVILQARMTSSGDDLARTLTKQTATFNPPKMPGMSELRDEIEISRKKLYNIFAGTDGTLPPARMEKVFEEVRRLDGLVTSVSVKYNRNLDDYTKFIKRWWDPQKQAFVPNNIKTPIAMSNVEIEVMKKGQRGIKMFVVDLPVKISKGGIKPGPNIASRAVEGIEANLGKGMKLKYVPKGINAEYTSLDGLMTIEISKPISKLKPKDLQAAIDALSRRGLAIPLADKQHAEYQLLKSYFERYQPTKKIIPNWNMAFKDKLALYRKEAEGLFKSKLDLSPKFAYGKYGPPQPARFDLSAATKRGLRKKYVLSHDMNGDDVLSFLRKAKETKVGAVLSTEERYRVGINSAGLSSSTDQATGGARFGFTRITSTEFMDRTGKFGGARATLFFEPDAGFSMRAYNYRKDSFGNISPKVIEAEQFKPDMFAKSWNAASKGRGNETFIEGGIDLGDLKKIYVGSKQESDEAIALLKSLEQDGVVAFKNKVESIVEIGGP